MFISAIERLGSDEQGEKWIKNARHLKMIGCYAQTELGHGSNVAGLETTATLDKETDEWVIHSPTVTSTKFWPGGLGLWSNYAVVFAQCIVDENNYGVMGFVVPIRNLETHMPLKGIQLGDMGTKLGYNSVDNGWLIFNKVRIPRTNMLSRFVFIDQDGSMEIRGNLKAIYSTMVNIRSQLIFNCGYVINRAMIIGVRYSVCRR
jgi:acyl-CoA oxidase